MQNRVYVICMYGSLTPVYSETTDLSSPRSVRKFLRKRLQTQKVDSTGYYGIEDPFPDLISKLLRFMGYGVPIVGCQEAIQIVKRAITTSEKRM